MSDKIIINKDKIIYRFWSMDERKEIDKEIEPFYLVDFLWENIEFEDVTLNRIFEVISNNFELWQKIINENIQPILIESKFGDNKQTRDDLLSLEIAWDACFEPEFNEINISTNFYAWGEEDGVHYGVSFTPSYILKNLPIKLNTKFRVYKFCEEGEHQFGDKQFTVLEVIKAIFWELTFHGTPENRDNLWKEITNEIAEAKDSNEIGNLMEDPI